jgi:hypothetical protein
VDDIASDGNNIVFRSDRCCSVTADDCAVAAAEVNRTFNNKFVSICIEPVAACDDDVGTRYYGFLLDDQRVLVDVATVITCAVCCYVVAIEAATFRERDRAAFDRASPARPGPEGGRGGKEREECERDEV